MRNERQWIDLARAEVSNLAVDELVREGVLLDDHRFMPVITYPPVTLYPKAEPEDLLGRNTAPPAGPCAVYVHIPFCPFKC